jgi:hypothetical protein
VFRPRTAGVIDWLDIINNEKGERFYITQSIYENDIDTESQKRSTRYSC